jgi:hypothetical protein
MQIMEVMRKATGRGFDEEGIYQQGFGLDEFAPMAGTVRERANLGGSALQDLFGMTNEERKDAGLTFENTFINDERQTPTFELKWLQDLIKAGTRGSAGRYGSRFLASRLPYMQTKFDLQRGTPGMATNFVDFFKNRFGI